MAGFSIPLAQLAERMKLDLDTVARNATLEVFKGVVLKTPVDTERARGNWNVSTGAPDTSTTPTADQARGLTEVAKAASIASGGIVYLANSLPYARVLEYGEYPNPPKKGKGKTAGGFSRQAPQGMVRITAMEFSDHVQKAISEK
jgi:hypothetical protein